MDTKESDLFESWPGIHDPIPVRVELSIFYCTNSQLCSANQNNINKGSFIATEINKHLLNVFTIKFIFGQVKLRTTIDCIQFEIDKHKHDFISSNLKDTAVSTKSKNSIDYQDSDRTIPTMTENVHDEKLESDLIEFKLEQLVPLTNGGNVDTYVACYFSYDNKKDNITQNQPHELIFKGGYELKLIEPVLYLEANSRTKSYVQLLLNKLKNPPANANAENLLCENSNIKMIVEIKPNGNKSELPIYILLTPNKVVSESVTSNNSNSFKVEEAAIIPKYVHM